MAIRRKSLFPAYLERGNLAFKRRQTLRSANPRQLVEDVFAWLMERDWGPLEVVYQILQQSSAFDCAVTKDIPP